jgi:hypothetical protein
LEISRGSIVADLALKCSSRDEIDFQKPSARSDGRRPSNPIA